MAAHAPAADGATARGVHGILERVVLGAGLWILAVSLAAAVLSALGWWRPPLALTVAVVAALVVIVVLRPGRTALPASPVATWMALALVALALAFATWSGLTAAEQVLPRRDAASNLQAAISLARTGQRVVALDAARLGGPAVLDLPGITVASPAFDATGSAASPSIQPQFVIGPAAIYSYGTWAGVAGATWCAAIAGGLGVLALGLLATRVIGRWGPVAAGLTALSLPILHVSRSTYSEPLSLVTLGAGLLALVLMVAADRDVDPGPARRWAVMAGLLIGGTTLVRIDGLRDAVLLIPVAGLGLAQHARWPRHLLTSAAVATTTGLGVALALSDRYLSSIAPSLVPLVGLGAGMAVLTWGGLRLRSGRIRSGRRLAGAMAARCPVGVAGCVAAGLVLLASRPLWLVVRQDPNDPGSRYAAGMQAREGLPVDGGRTYAEHTITWLQWWLGPSALILAGTALVVAAHVLTRSWTAGTRLPAWSAPLLVAAGSSVLTLWRPGITPDHPWAERRLVIAVPLVLLLAVAALAYVVRQASSRHTAWGWPVGIVLVLALGTPVVTATAPFALARVERGEASAVERVCGALSTGDVVLAVDSRAANEWPQVIRGQCGRQSLSTTSALRKDPMALERTIEQVRTQVRASGGRLVLLSADDRLPALTAPWITTVDVVVPEEPHLLEHRPAGLDPLRIVVRLARS